MNLQSLASHTIDVDLLPDEPMVLDVGCRWFDFTRGILAQRPTARVICLDPSSDVEWDATMPPRVTLLHLALIGGDSISTNFAEGIAGDGGGNFALNEESYGDYKIRRVLALNIEKLMSAHALMQFDAVKLDCEGSEFGILENWPGPIATQISVEFHDCFKKEIRDGDYYTKLMAKLPWYRLVQHDLSVQGTGLGHWDSLLCLK